MYIQLELQQISGYSNRQSVENGIEQKTKLMNMYTSMIKFKCKKKRRKTGFW